MNRLTRIGLATGLALVGLSGIVAAQVPPTVVPIQPVINPNDALTGVAQGVPSAQMQAWNPAQVAGVPGYINAGVTTSGFSLTFGNSTSDIFMQPAGTLATGTLTTAANPSDGQRECVLSTQTQTALTWNANTGQTISGAPTALVANTPACMTYVKSLQTWFRSP